MNGSLFLEKLVPVWVYFHILWWHIPTETKLEYPLAPQCGMICDNFVCTGISLSKEAEMQNFSSNHTISKQEDSDM